MLRKFRRNQSKDPRTLGPSEKENQPGVPPVLEYDIVKAHEDVVAKRRGGDVTPLAPRIGEVLKVPEETVLEFRKRTQSSKPAPFVVSEELKKRSESHAKERVKVYDDLRERVNSYESALGFEFACKKKAKDIEKNANEVLQHLKKNDIARFYETVPKKRGYRGQEHPRFYGDHFLSNVDLIEQTQLFALCRAMPKGAHLHIHFNANLQPNFLLDIAKDMERMFLWSNVPLVEDDAFDRCRIQFSIMNETAVAETGAGDLFDENYQPGKVMRFQDFRKEFADRYGRGEDVDAWLQNKLVFQEEEAHNLLQTPEGAWEKFNARTQMMKGLFNYETAYRKYTRRCLQEFQDDNIQYAEIRPNFMSSNQVWKDDGSSKIDNIGIMNLIIEEYEAFQEEHQRRVFKGLKIIYCTPRSFNNGAVAAALRECFEFKMNERFSKYIAGFDLVGEESKGRPLKDFREEFLQFKYLCASQGTDIPFLFHCGETLGIGTDTDGNLVDALLLGSKRIGHGFALPRHPYVMELMKQRNVCVEVCPISNEILGLTPRISGHSVYNLLANDVHCTVSTDNGTLFRSRLSHDFYQVLAGKSDMTLHGLRQLIEWSIEHSCMEPELKTEVRKDWEQMWDEFCLRIVRGDFTIKGEGPRMGG
ncbi:hypothetical protein VTK56DRAFT_2847 [Thermocarpiscus australiensis]